MSPKTPTEKTPTERLLHELTERYGSVQALFAVLDLLRADPNEVTETIQGLPLHHAGGIGGGRHRAQ
jgi:hypothetical protein